MARLKGHVVCITGASRGLGAALAKAFSEEGCHLVLGARSQNDLDKLAKSLPSAITLQCDVTQVEDINGLLDAAVAEFDRLDVMINCAAVSLYGPFLDTSEEEFDRMVATNLRGTFFGSQAALDLMRVQHRGLIVNFSCLAGRHHLPNQAAFGVTKWAGEGLTESIRREAAQHNVRVTCVVAGGINTPVWSQLDFYPFPPEIEPERDFMNPDEVAQMVVDVACRSDRFSVPQIVCTPLMPNMSVGE